MLAIGTKPSGLCCSYRWRINNCYGLHNLLLMWLRARSVEVTDNRCHTGLVAHGGRQVDGLLGVILGEAGGFRKVVSLPGSNFPREWGVWANLRLNPTTVNAGALPWEEGQRTVTRSLKLTVRPRVGDVSKKEPVRNNLLWCCTQPQSRRTWDIARCVTLFRFEGVNVTWVLTWWFVVPIDRVEVWMLSFSRIIGNW